MNNVNGEQWLQLKSVRRKLGCFHCSSFVENPMTLTGCTHIYCLRCLEEVCKQSTSPCCGNLITTKDFTSQSRLLTNISESFRYFHSCLEKYLLDPSIVSKAVDFRDQYVQDNVIDVEQCMMVEGMRPGPGPCCPEPPQKNQVSLICKSSNIKRDTALDTFFADDYLSSSIVPDVGCVPNSDGMVISNENRGRVGKKSSINSSVTLDFTHQISLATTLQEEDCADSTITPVGSFSTISQQITQHSTFNSVEAQILHSKKALRLILDADHIKSSSVPIVSTSIEKVDEIFEWGDYGIPVVAEFSTMENRIFFEESCKKGWISCTNNPIDSSQKRKFLVTEAVVQEKPNSSLARRTILYMKCLLSGFEIIDFLWLRDSIAVDRLLNPHNYEIFGTNQDIIIGYPSRYREIFQHKGRPNIFKGYLFRILNDTRLSLKIKPCDVEQLILLAGGNIICGDTWSNCENQKMVVISLSLKTKRCRSTSLEKSLDISNCVLSVSWIFDCICNMQVFSFGEYVLCTLL